MRVVQFIDTLRSGGKERQLVELLKGLAQVDGVECELIVMSENVHYTDLYNLQIPVHTLLRKSKKDPSIFFRLYRLLKQLQPDILHSWSSMCSVYALPCVKLLNIQFVNGFLRNAPPSLAVTDKEWLRSRITFPFSDAIVANSKAGLKAYNAPPAKSHCIYNGFDFSRLQNLKPIDAVRKEYGIQTRYVVGMVATFSEKKDFATFIKAAQRVLSKRRDVTFLAVGDGQNRAQCQAMVDVRDQQHIIFPGKIKEVESLVQVFDIGVLMSNIKVHGEGISNTLMEYMAQGKPVIASNCGGNKELVVDGKTGWLVSDGDTTGLAQRVLDLLEHPEWARQTGRHGAERLHNIFNHKKLTQNYFALYRLLTK